MRMIEDIKAEYTDYPDHWPKSVEIEENQVVVDKSAWAKTIEANEKYFALGTPDEITAALSRLAEYEAAERDGRLAMAEIIKGVSPDAEIVTNERGGKQSKTAYGFHLIDTDAILSLAEVLQYGASRYERDNWRKIPAEEHFNHMMIHYYAWLKGDKTDDHLGHFFCRAMMVYATAQAGNTN